AGPAPAGGAAAEADGSAEGAKAAQGAKASEGAKASGGGGDKGAAAERDFEAAPLKAKAKEGEDNPLDVILDAAGRSDALVKRGERTFAEAQAQLQRLADLRASRGTRAAARRTEELLHGVRQAQLSLARVGRDWSTLHAARSIPGATGDAVAAAAVQLMREHAEDASKQVEHMMQGARVTVEHLKPLAEGARAGALAPSLLDTADAPELQLPGAPEQAPEVDVPTASGCTCAPSSKCASRGRQFTWCVTSDTKKCPLRADPGERDAGGADHRVAGAGRRGLSADCRPPSSIPEAPRAAHAGAHCADRDDLFERYPERTPSTAGRTGPSTGRGCPGRTGWRWRRWRCTAAQPRTRRRGAAGRRAPRGRRPPAVHPHTLQRRRARVPNRHGRARARRGRRVRRRRAAVVLGLHAELGLLHPAAAPRRPPAARPRRGRRRRGGRGRCGRGGGCRQGQGGASGGGQGQGGCGERRPQVLQVLQRLFCLLGQRRVQGLRRAGRGGNPGSPRMQPEGLPALPPGCVLEVSTSGVLVWMESRAASI
ncbi:unnamed protein product, partial [Prorocentrum cordatum]